MLVKELDEGGGKDNNKKKRLRNKFPPTLLTCPLVLLLGVTACERPLTLFTGESPALRHRAPPPPQSSSSFSIVSTSFSIRNKYIHLIIGSSFEKKAVLCHSVGGVPECWMVRKSRLSTSFYHWSFLYANQPTRPPAHLFTVAGVFRQGLGNRASRRTRAPAIPCQRGT